MYTDYEKTFALTPEEIEKIIWDYLLDKDMLKGIEDYKPTNIHHSLTYKEKEDNYIFNVSAHDPQEEAN